jgi:hypothetical protein
MQQHVTARCAAILEVLRSTIAAADKLSSGERDLVFAALVADIRSRNPECVSPLRLGPPSDPAAIRDPRGTLP